LGAKHVRAVASALVLAHAVQTRALPRLRIDLDQKRAQAVAELVAVRDEHAVLRFAKDQRDGMEELARAVPRELVAPRLERRPEMLGEMLAHRAVRAVARDD